MISCCSALLLKQGVHMPDVDIESRMPLHDSYSYYLKDTLLEIVRIVSSLAVSSTKETTSGMVKACR